MSAKRAAIAKRAATSFTVRRNAAEGVHLQCRCGTGRNISFDRRGPQRGFNDSPDSVLFRKSMRQREIDALVINQAKLRRVLADELFDSRTVVVAENDELTLDQNGRNVP